MPVPLGVAAAQAIAAGLSVGGTAGVFVGLSVAGVSGARYLVNRTKRDDFSRRNLGFTGEVSGSQQPLVVVYGSHRIGGTVS